MHPDWIPTRTNYDTGRGGASIDFIVIHYTQLSYTPQRVAAQTEDRVPPGGTATFTFSVTGELAGQYVLPLRPLVEGAAWMDDLGLYTVITVH